MSVYDPETMTPRARRRSTSTSVAAAIDATKRAPTMTDLIWAIYQTGPHTAEEIHAKMTRNGERVLLNSVRARICGLHKAGRLTNSGEKGLGESLKSKVVRWRITTPEELSEAQARREACQ